MDFNQLRRCKHLHGWLHLTAVIVNLLPVAVHLNSVSVIILRVVVRFEVVVRVAICGYTWRQLPWNCPPVAVRLDSGCAIMRYGSNSGGWLRERQECMAFRDTTAIEYDRTQIHNFARVGSSPFIVLLFKTLQLNAARDKLCRSRLLCWNFDYFVRFFSLPPSSIAGSSMLDVVASRIWNSVVTLIVRFCSSSVRDRIWYLDQRDFSHFIQPLLHRSLPSQIGSLFTKPSQVHRSLTFAPHFHRLTPFFETNVIYPVRQSERQRKIERVPTSHSPVLKFTLPIRQSPLHSIGA